MEREPLYRVGDRIACTGNRKVIKSCYLNKNGVVNEVREGTIDNKPHIIYTVTIDGNSFRTILTEDCLVRYVIRVYKTSPVADYTAEKNNYNIIIQRGSNTKNNLMRLWKGILEAYEGYEYCIKDMLMGEVVVKGRLHKEHE